MGKYISEMPRKDKFSLQMNSFFASLADGSRDAIHLSYISGADELKSLLFPILGDIESPSGSVGEILRLRVVERSKVHDYLVFKRNSSFYVINSPIAVPKSRLYMVNIETAVMEGVLRRAERIDDNPASGLLPPIESALRSLGVSVVYSQSRDFFVLDTGTDKTPITTWTKTRFPVVFGGRRYAKSTVNVVVLREMSLISIDGEWHLVFTRPNKMWYMSSGVFPEDGAIDVVGRIFVYPSGSAKGTTLKLNRNHIWPDNDYLVEGDNLYFEVPDHPLVWGWRLGIVCKGECTLKDSLGNTIKRYKDVVIRVVPGVRDWTLNRRTPDYIQ